MTRNKINRYILTRLGSARLLARAGDFLLFFLITLSASNIQLSQAQSAPQNTREDAMIADMLNAVKTEQPLDKLFDENRELITADLWKKLTKRALSDYYSVGSDQSIRLYRLAFNIAQRLKDQRLIAVSHYNLGRTFSSLSQTEAAIASYQESRKAFESAGLRRDGIYILGDLAALYYYGDKYNQARQFAEQSIALADELKGSTDPPGLWPDEYGVAAASSILGALDRQNGDFKGAIEHIEKSIELYQGLDRGTLNYGFFLSDNTTELGRVYSAMGDNIQAFKYLNQALNIAKKLPQRDSMANVLNSIGVLYLEQEEYDKAKAHLEQSLEIYRAIKNQTEEARILLNLGVLEQRRGHFDESLGRFDASMNLAKSTANKDVEIAVGEGMGVVYREQKKYEAALNALDRSLLLAEEIGDPLRIAEVMWRKAELKHEVGALVESAELAEKAYQIAHQMRAPKLSYLTATTLGKVYRAQRKSGEAFQTLSQAIDRIESMREQIVGQEQEQQLYFENKVTAYHELIDLLVAQNREFDALTFAERAKGRVLLDVLSKGRVVVENEMTEQERGEEQTLNQKIVQLNNALREERQNAKTDDAKINALNQQLDVARSQYGSFQDVLQAAHPDFRLRRGVIPSITVGSLNSLFADREPVYLDYVVAKERTYLFLLCKSPQSENPTLKVISINISEKELTKLVTGFHQSIAEHRVIFSPQGKELYDLLIKPIANSLHDKEIIYILPDKILWDLPFQALQTANGRYLLEDIAISYAPSLSVLVEMTKKKMESKPTLLSFGNPQTGQNRRGAAPISRRIPGHLTSLRWGASPFDASIEIGFGGLPSA